MSRYFVDRWADGFADAAVAFLVNRDWPALVAAYWKHYIGRVPARSFGNLTEAFFQLTFGDLCWSKLASHYTIHVEPNLHSGLADFVALPVNDDGRAICVIEFKYRKGAKGGVRSAGKPKVRATVTAADRRQVAAYAADVAAKYPGRAVEAYVAAVVGNRAYALRRVK